MNLCQPNVFFLVLAVAACWGHVYGWMMYYGFRTAEEKPKAIEKVIDQRDTAIQRAMEAEEKAWRLVEALEAMTHDRPSAHSDRVWKIVQDALAAHQKASGM
jgi:hypothetical protein